MLFLILFVLGLVFFCFLRSHKNQFDLKQENSGIMKEKGTRRMLCNGSVLSE